MNDNKLTKEQSEPKIKQYCMYQERCRADVEGKLKSFNLCQNEVEEIISWLIKENYLNEERFAIQFAGGKFRMKQWGRVKIKYALLQKQVSGSPVKKALKQIAENDYHETLNKLAAQKLKTLIKEKNTFSKKRKLQDYLLQKGFERELVNRVISEPG